MNLLLISPLPPPAGGIRTVSESLVRFIRNSENGIEVAVCNTTHRFRPETSESKAIRIFSGIQNALETLYRLEKAIRREKPDIIHLASSSSLALIKDFLILKRSRMAKIPVVIHWHFGRIPELKAQQNREWKFLKKVIKASDWSVVIDEKSFQTLKEEGFTNIAYIPNSLPPDVVKKAGEMQLNGHVKHQDRIIYVGHIIKNKGVFELVNACSQIETVKELICIGKVENQVKKELEKIARIREKGEWLQFTGELNKNEVLEFMAQSEVLALPSYTEGFPMVVLEAMAMGCAVIATSVGAIQQMLAVQSRNPGGICVPPRDTEKLREAIEVLTKNPSLCEVYGQRGRKRVLENYTMEKVFSQYQTVWERVLEKS